MRECRGLSVPEWEFRSRIEKSYITTRKLFSFINKEKDWHINSFMGHPLFLILTITTPQKIEMISEMKKNILSYHCFGLIYLTAYQPLMSYFANGSGDRRSIPGRVIPKTLKMVLDASLLNTLHYKVRIKGKVEKSLERNSALPYTLV